MQLSGEKLCLQWNDFRDNISSAFGDLRDDEEFTDVTLACEDGQQVKVHKVVLIASSPFFLNLLKKNKHPHPLVFMRGVKFEDLVSMVDFLYIGEANVYQENLDSFLAMAEELKLKGLKRQEEVDLPPEKALKRRPTQDKGKAGNYFPTSKQKPLTPESNNETKMSPAAAAETTLALNGSFDLEELDRKVKSMMAFSENVINKGRARICKECGKEGQMITIMGHIEANHMPGLCIPCNHCEKTLSTRMALTKHVRKFHSQSVTLDQ